jgi:hypothetical protein
VDQPVGYPQIPGRRITPVGASLLAKALGQISMGRLTHCIREQARSHI